MKAQGMAASRQERGSREPSASDAQEGSTGIRPIRRRPESLGRRGPASARVDPHLRAIIDRIGPCRLEPHPDRFGTLVRSIIGQQISTKAAASINQRLVALGGDPTSRRD